MLESGDMQPSQDVIMSTYRFGIVIFQAQDHKIAAALSARKSLLTDEAEHKFKYREGQILCRRLK
jgi:hypothetical protein